MAGEYDFTINQGETFARTLTWTISGVPVDLTNYSAKMQLRILKSSVDPLITLSSPSSGITLGGASGTIVLGITAGSTTNLDFNCAFYDLEMTNGGGDVKRLLQGTVTLDKEVTK